MPLDLERIPFGLANITLTEGTGVDAKVISFDGVDELQAEGGEVSLAPMYEDVTIADYGNGPYDKRLVGYEGTVTIVAAQETLRVLELAISGTETITSTDGGGVTGLTDAPIGSSLRKKGKRVNIHPRNLPALVKDNDITIYKVVSDGEYTRANANSQGSITINLTMLPRDGMDPKKAGNFFYVGGTDPSPDA